MHGFDIDLNLVGLTHVYSVCHHLFRLVNILVPSFFFPKTEIPFFSSDSNFNENPNFPIIYEKTKITKSFKSEIKVKMSDEQKLYLRI